MVHYKYSYKPRLYWVIKGIMSFFLTKLQLPGEKVWNRVIWDVWKLFQNNCSQFLPPGDRSSVVQGGWRTQHLTSSRSMLPPAASLLHPKCNSKDCNTGRTLTSRFNMLLRIDLFYFLCMMWSEDLNSSFRMWISNYSSTICWKGNSHWIALVPFSKINWP